MQTQATTSDFELQQSVMMEVTPMEEVNIGNIVSLIIVVFSL
jgi:hypothetical protein